MPLHVSGSYIRLLSASGPLKVSADGGNKFDFELGIGVRFPERFRFLSIESATNQTVRLAVSDAGVDDSRLVGSVDITGGLDTKEVMPTNLTAAAVTVGTSAVVVAAANVDRRSVLIVNNAANVIYVGPAGVTTATGVPVAAGGGALTLNTTAAIYAIAGSAGNNVRVLQESM